MSEPSYDDLREGLGDPVLDAEMLDRALTHRSFAYENGGLPTNERLEFLGDSVLGVVVTDTLFRAHPDLSEGRLAKLRAAVVNARALAEVARTIDLGRAHQAGSRRGVDGRAQQVLDPVRHGRGADRRGLPQRRLRGLQRGRAPAVRPADGERRPPRRRPGLEDQPPGALRRALARRPRVRHRGRRARTTRRPSPRRCGWAPASTGTAPAGPRRRPSSRPPRRPTSPSPPTHGDLTAARSSRACPSSPRSRSSAAASSPTSSVARSPASTCCTRARCAGTSPVPRTSPR